ncbi:uncharacterized protein ISCGN_031805 [Ixodes scapularis]
MCLSGGGFFRLNKSLLVSGRPMPPARKQRRRRNKASSRQGMRERDVPKRKDAEAAARQVYAARITRGVKSLCYQRESLIARRTDGEMGVAMAFAWCVSDVVDELSTRPRQLAKLSPIYGALRARFGRP